MTSWSRPRDDRGHFMRPGQAVCDQCASRVAPALRGGPISPPTGDDEAEKIIMPMDSRSLYDAVQHITLQVRHKPSDPIERALAKAAADIPPVPADSGKHRKPKPVRRTRWWHLFGRR